MFYGLWRHIDEIKSLEGIDICWIEEAHNLTEEQWNILEPTLRKEGSQFWIIFNPRLVTDFVYRRFISNTPPDTIKKQINYVDNPFLSATILKVIEAKRNEDEEEFRHIYRASRSPMMMRLSSSGHGSLQRSMRIRSSVYCLLARNVSVSTLPTAAMINALRSQITASSQPMWMSGRRGRTNC